MEPVFIPEIYVGDLQHVEISIFADTVLHLHFKVGDTSRSDSLQVESS